MSKESNQEQGSALVFIFGFCLLLGAVLSFFADSVNLKKNLRAKFEREVSLKQSAENLTELAISHILNKTTAYDAPEHFRITPNRINAFLSADYQATVEIRDEGSRFNPNNLPISYWQEYFHNSPQSYERLYAWSFRQENQAGNLSTTIRNNYLLTLEDLQEVLAETPAPSSLTIFGPANYYLIDGEVLVSLLLRSGLQMSSVAIETTIENFNSNRNQIFTENIATLLSQLHLPELPKLDKIEQLFTAKGSINPNFIEPAYLRLLVPEGKGRDFSDLSLLQKEQPFISITAFEDYLCNQHGISISREKIARLFSVKSKVFGIYVSIYNQDKQGLLELNTIVQRGWAEQEDSWQIIYRRENWLSGKKESDD